MRTEEFHDLVTKLCDSCHWLPKACLLRLADLDMEQRSAVTKLCRAQVYPVRGTRLYTMTSCVSSSIRDDILPLCQTPLMAGLVLQLVLIAPMTELEVTRAFSQSLCKEVEVMESVMRECTLNFDAFFGSYNDTIHPSIVPNRRVAEYVHKGIDRWVESLQTRVLFPTIGSKTVSKLTRNEVLGMSQDYEQADNKGITPVDVERVYYRYGVKVGGPCELRQVWYPSNLQPRTYFAQGGYAFHSSKYLAKPFVDLCDTLPSTNRRTRVDPSRISIRRPSDDVAYYDLTSFTSNLHVQRDFVQRLSVYCAGKTVNILDSVEGISPVDLGDLIGHYMLTNLCNPSYTLPSHVSDPTVLHYHGVAGFLGVYGNIATATFVHGIVMAMLHNEFDENNVAGDDGLDVTDDVQYTLQVVGLLGTVKDEKTFRASERGCIHLKRPIRRVTDRLFLGQLFAWPSLEPGQRMVDVRYPQFRRMTDQDKKGTIASSITAFLRSLTSQTMTHEELDVVETYLSHMYDTFNLPRSGWVSQTSGDQSGFVPAFERRYIGMDPIRNTLMRHYTGIARLPLRGWCEWDHGLLEDDTFRCNSSPLLRHLVTLGCLDQKKVSILVFGEGGLTQLLKEYEEPDPTIYEYAVIRELPRWIDRLFPVNQY